MVRLQTNIKGFSLIEVLISLSIVSFSILYLLTLAASATRRATINKIQIQMNSVAASILEQTRATLYTKQQDDDWDALLNQSAIIIDSNTHEVIASNTCNFENSPLSANCPSVSSITEDAYDFLGYVIKPEQLEANLYKITIKVDCKDNSSNKCPVGLRPIILETYISKY